MVYNMYLRHWIEIDVNNLVQVACNHLPRERERERVGECMCDGVRCEAYLGDLKQCLEVELSLWSDEPVESNGGQVTHCHLERGKVGGGGGEGENENELHNTHTHTHLIWTGELHYLSTEVAAFDGPQILQHTHTHTNSTSAPCKPHPSLSGCSSCCRSPCTACTEFRSQSVTPE